jgi:hypothetical protein
MKALYALAFGLLGQFAAAAAAPVYTASHTIQLSGEKFYSFPDNNICGTDFAQSDESRTAPGTTGWNSGYQSYTATAIPKNMSVKSVSVTVNYSIQVETPISLNLNGVWAETVIAQPGPSFYYNCQTVTFELPVSAYNDGGLNTVYISPGASAVMAVSTETVTITYSNGKNNGNNQQGGLVQICHKGDPIRVSSSAVAAHMAHGDSMGDCTTAAKAAPGVATELSVSPNPATDQVAFAFQAARAGKAELQVFNQWGKLVATVYSRESAAGERNVVPFNGHDLPEGLYLCRLVTADGVQTTRLKVAR